MCLSVDCFTSRYLELLWVPLFLSQWPISLWKMWRDGLWPLTISSYLFGRDNYVDDICTIVPKHNVQHLLEHINGIEKSVQFTVELETGNCLSFLDIQICRVPDGSLSTSVFRKATHTNQYLDFHSHHPLSHKRAVVCTLSKRAETHSSSEDSKSKEMLTVSSALKLNGYPEAMI